MEIGARTLVTATVLHAITQRVLSGQAPEPLCQAVARGAVPVSPEELLQLRVHLCGSRDDEVGEASRAAILQQAAVEILPLLGDGCSTEVLDFLARQRGGDVDIMEVVVRHPATPEAALVAAAGGASEEVLDRITDNQVRLLESPALVDALEASPVLSGMARARLHDVRAELGRRQRRQAPPRAPQEEPAAAGATAIEEIHEAEGPLEADTGEEATDPAHSLEGFEAEEMGAAGETLFRIMKLGVPERITLALMGTREERALLVRDKVKAVSLAVLKSPKINEREVEAIAAMRNVVDDVIRVVAEHREWTKSYAVIHALCKNPKSPVRKTLSFMTRLTNRDLKMLIADRGIPEAVRTNARRFFMARTESKGSAKRK